MDNDDKKVFVAGVTRSASTLKNDLYDIIQKDVAKPITSNEEVHVTCDFTPSCGKFYMPKKKSKHKVVTVRDIRNLYEKDIFETLPQELEKQQKLLLRKIRDGFSNDNNTRNIALNILKSNRPLSRSSWQMLMNLNPERHTHSSQFVLWNGQRVQVNGSRGGKNKFICHYDISKVQKNLKKSTNIKSKILNKRRGLLRDSLNIKFKPGPLTKKVELDYSYQKYHVGKIELIDLPRPGLYIKPTYGTVLEPMVKSFLQNLRQEDGFISEKWAEFAVSVIGKVSSKGLEIEADKPITFNLNYKYNQKRILMRHDSNIVENTSENNLSSSIECTAINESVLMSDVKHVLDKILDSVEISVNQDLFYSGVEDPRELLNADSPSDICGPIKEKVKRKYCELDRLDVTVIRLTDKRKKSDGLPCRQLFCSLGCVCDSLERGYGFKSHCGQVDCMFDCKCEFSKYKLADTLDGNCSDLLPGLFHLDKKVNDKLSKEEQKFHQTVIVTDDKSILLKSKRRNWKTSKKYADFYSSMPLRADLKKSERFLCIAIPKLKCDNVEPWCMVHNLYKCFCKGKFIQSVINNLSQIEEINTNNIIYKETDALPVVDLTKTETNNAEVIMVPSTILFDYYSDLTNDNCARIVPFAGRKYSDGYYLRTNEKILEMEKNDMKLQTKILNLMSKSCENEDIIDSEEQNDADDSDNLPFRLDDLLSNILHEQEKLISSMCENRGQSGENTEIGETRRLPNKTKLVEWLETSYKKYKERVDKGLWKTVLTPPRSGKVALYPWDFILSRYQERKNLFLISKQKPFRIFMAVNAKHILFEHCINIRNIPQSNINEYPKTVRNLINNVKHLKDNFCILCGLSNCWELVGSVTKINENKIVQSNLNTTKKMADNLELSKNFDSFKHNTGNCSSVTNVTTNSNIINQNELSRWFVMAIEDDVTEIQFFIKGFFVKYESIVKAIQVSRRVKKTVRLSSQRCCDGGEGPQFGIYATPNMNENSVFVGPYKYNEPLGIETLKNPVQAFNKNKTRGLWITIKNTENTKVIDSPLSFMPSFKQNNDKVVTLDNNFLSEIKKNEQRKSITVKLGSSSESEHSPVKSKAEPVKTVKPIKIRKTDGFYHLAPQTLLKKLPIRKCTDRKKENTGKGDLLSSDSLPNIITSIKGSERLALENSEKKFKPVFNKPVAEIAPQIKITNIASLCNNTPNKKIEKGMFVLKPEEINNRLINNFFRVMHPDESRSIKNSTVVSNKETRLNVEEFLDSSKICTPPVTDVYVISDDEEDYNNLSAPSSWRKVWITCTNIKTIGWILGRRNNKNKLSFEFPGFVQTTFYDEDEAFKKINQIISRKVYVPKNIALKWRVEENELEVKSEHKLELEDLSTDFVLTKHGLMHKSSLLLGNVMKINNIKDEITAVASTSMKYDEVNVVIGKEEIIDDDVSDNK